MADNKIDFSQLGPSLLEASSATNLPTSQPLDNFMPSSIVGSLFRRENMIGSFLEQQSLERELSLIPSQEDYDYFDNVPEDLFDHRDRYVSSTSQDATDAITNQIRYELNDKRNMSMQPAKSLMLGLVVGNADPSILMPGGAVFKSASKGLSAAKSAMAIGAATGAAATFQELALNKTQQTRTLEESSYNVLAATLLGSAFGGIGGAVLGGPIGKKARADIVDTYANGYGVPHRNDLSAAEFDPAYIKDSESLANMGRFVGQLGQKMTPFTRMIHSPFATVNRLVDNLYEHNLVKNKNLAENGSIANPISVETKIKLDFGQVERAQVDFQDIFFRQRGIEGGPFKPERGFFSKQGLNWDEFNLEVTRAIREGGQHANPDVAAGAKLMTEKVFNPLRDRAIELGLLPKNVDVKTALGYFMRNFNLQKIKENPAQFKADIKPDFVAKNEKLKEFQPTIVEYQERIKKATQVIARSKKNQARLNKLLKESNAKNKAEIDKLKKKLEKESLAESETALKALEKEFDDIVPFDLKDSDGRIRSIMDDEQINLAVEQTYDNVIGRNAEKMMNPNLGKLSRGKAKPLNNRAWLIQDSIIENWTINDASKVADSYARSMAPTLRLHEMAKSMVGPDVRNTKLTNAMIKRENLQSKIETGTKAEIEAAKAELLDINETISSLERPPTPSEALGEFLVELTEELEAAKRGKTVKENRKLEADYEQAKSDVIHTFELLEGVYGQGSNMLDGKASQVVRNIKTWNFIRLLGFMTISSIPDIGTHLMRHGPMAFMRDGIVPLVKTLASKEGGLAHNKELLQDMNRALNTVNGQRLKSMLDHEGNAVSSGLFTKGLDFTAKRFGNATLMNQWQDMMQTIAGNMSMSRTLRDIDTWAKTGKMDKKGLERLVQLGVGKEHWPAIHNEWKKTGGIDGGSYWANYGDWDLAAKESSSAYDIFKAAALKEVDSTIVLPGLADKPLFTQTEYGSLVGQFKSFMFASTNKTLMAGLTRNDAEFWMGSVAMLSLGALGYVTTSLLRNPDKEVDLSWERLTQEAIDRSGLLGVYMEAYNIGGKLLGADGVSRYRSRGITGALAGPTAGLVDEVSYMMNKVSRSIRDDDVDFTTQDAEKLMRLAPFQNLFYLYSINRQLTNKAALGLGFEEQ